MVFVIMTGVLYLVAIFNFFSLKLSWTTRKQSLLSQKVTFLFLTIGHLSVFTGEIVGFYLASHQVAKHKATRYFPGEHEWIFIKKMTCMKKITIPGFTTVNNSFQFIGEREVDINIFSGVLLWKLKGISWNLLRRTRNTDYVPQYQTW